MQYALFYIDFFVNNIQKKSPLNCFKWRFYHCLRYFFNNVLYRAFSISTARNWIHLSKLLMVSMPFIGLSPFLRSFWFTISCSCSICVNALYRAFSISTEYLQVQPSEIMSVNALYRAFSISTNESEDYVWHYIVCQCPLSGFLHFYKKTFNK